MRTQFDGSLERATDIVKTLRVTIGMALIRWVLMHPFWCIVGYHKNGWSNTKRVKYIFARSVKMRMGVRLSPPGVGM